MTASRPVSEADDYVVRYGLRGLCGALLGLALWTGLACMIAIRATRPSIPAATALGFGEIGLLAACAVEIWRAARREIVFAVSQDGVYFGPSHGRNGQLAEPVSWDKISAIELFTERAPVRGVRSSHRCVGVRMLDDGEHERGPAGAAGPRPPANRGDGSLLEADRIGPPLDRGEAAGVRLAYRRMSGWRVNRTKLVAAVRQHAPEVPVIGERAG